MKKIFIILFLFILAGCMTKYQLVEVGYVDFKKNFKIYTPIKWNKVKEGNVTVWTVNGELLDGIIFFENIKDSQTLVQGKEKSEKSRVYKKEMTEVEVADLIAETIRYDWGATDFEYINLKPKNFGSKKGFYFDLEYKHTGGAEFKGFAIGSKEDDILNIILFYGTKLYHFDKYSSEVNQIFDSIEQI